MSLATHPTDVGPGGKHQPAKLPPIESLAATLQEKVVAVGDLYGDLRNICSAAPTDVLMGVYRRLDDETLFPDLKAAMRRDVRDVVSSEVLRRS